MTETSQDQPQELSPVKQAICDRIASGETMQRLCDDKDMPSRVTVFRWRQTDHLFNETLTHAYQSAATVYGDRVLDIAEDMAKGATKDEAMGARVASDNYKWAASKFYARVFGEQQPRSLHQTYVAGDVTLVADEPKRQAMIQARQQFLSPGDKTSDLDADLITSDNGSSNKSKRK